MLQVHDLESIRRRLARALAPPRQRYRPLLVEGSVAGSLDDKRAARLAGMTDVFDVRNESVTFIAGLEDVNTRSLALDRAARLLAADGLLTAWRDERYPVASEFGAPPWFFLERAAARYFGIHTYAAHVNGVVRADREILMWIARRSATKAIDPGMLDNLVGGGISAGQSLAATVMKEAWEEAGIAAPLAARAQSTGAVHLFREQSDGLQCETIFVHDLWLPADFVPRCQDGEVADYRLVPLRDAATLIENHEGPDVVTADASIVVLDFLLRHGEIAPDAPLYTTLEALRHPPLARKFSDAAES
jgi:8-oxo-dGTP pyrophosphatase MutT (NUDIX family)